MRVLLVVLLAIVAIPAAAQPTTGPATAAVQQADAALKKALSSNAPPASIAQAVQSLIDINELGKQAMATHWSTLKPAEQTKFLQLLNSLIQTSYVSARQANLNYTVQYLGETTNPKGQTVVHTKIQTQRKGRPLAIAIDYVMIKKGATYQAFDVITDGVGLVDNYQATFNSVIAKQGVSGLLQTMQDRLQQLQSSPATPTNQQRPTPPTGSATPAKP